MRVLSVAYGSRGDVEPMVGLAVQLRASGVEVQMPAEGLPERAAALVATTYDAVAEGCDAVVATGLFPAAAGARSVAEQLGIRYVWVAFLPSCQPSAVGTGQREHEHAARRGRPGEAARLRVSPAEPSSRNTRTLEPWRPEPATAARDFHTGPDTLPCATVAGGLASELIT